MYIHFYSFENTHSNCEVCLSLYRISQAFHFLQILLEKKKMIVTVREAKAPSFCAEWQELVKSRGDIICLNEGANWIWSARATALTPVPFKQAR